MKTEKQIYNVLEEEKDKINDPALENDDFIHQGWVEALNWILDVPVGEQKEPVRTEITYEEAIEKAIKSLWKVEECGTEDCWCACIGPAEKIKYQDRPGGYIEEIYIVPSGSLTKEIANHLVNLHNNEIIND